MELPGCHIIDILSYHLHLYYKEPSEKYTQLLEFHSKNIKLNNKHKDEHKIADMVTSSIASKLTTLFDNPDKFAANLEDSTTLFLKELKSSNIGPRKFSRLAHQFLDQPHNWRLLHETIRDILTRIKPKICEKYFTVLDSYKTPQGFNINDALVACNHLNTKLVISISEVDRKLLSSLLDKIIEDAIVILQETTESGEDPIPQEIPKEFIEPGSEINIDSDSDYESQGKSSDDNGSDKIKSDVIKNCKMSSESYINAINSFTSLLFSNVKEAYEQEITTQVTKPLLKTFLKYIEIANFKSEEPEGLSKYLEENADEKYSFEEKKKQVIAHQSMPFIVHDLQEVVRKKYEETPNEKLLETMIKHGHALSPMTMNILVHVLYRVFKKYIPDLNVIQVVLHSDDKELTFASAKIESEKPYIITLTLSQNYFYISQADSRKIFKNKNDTEYIGACLFESITKNNPEASEISKQGAASFRNLLLDHIYAPVKESKETLNGTEETPKVMEAENNSSLQETEEMEDWKDKARSFAKQWNLFGKK